MLQARTIGDARNIKVITPMTKEGILSFLEYKVQMINAKEINIKIHGNSGTAIPAYQVLALGTGKKLTSERMKRMMRRINRINGKVF